MSRSLVYKNILFSFVLFLAIMYLPGFIFSLLFTEYFSSYYAYNDFSYLNQFFFILILFSSLFFGYLLFNYTPVIHRPKISSDFIRFFVVLLVLLFFILSIYFKVNYSTGFRHSNRLSAASPLVTLLWAVRSLVGVLVLSLIIVACNGIKFSALTKILLIFITLASILSVTSSLQVLLPLICLLLLIYPAVYRLTITKIGVLKFIFLLLAALICFTFVLILGIGSKLGYENIFSENGFDLLINYISILIPRMSTSYVSFATLLDYEVSNLVSYDVFKSVHNTFMNRLYSILGESIFDTDMIDTVNRFNYLTVFENHADRAGASPGILASVFYMPFFPLGLFVSVLYLNYITSCVSRMATVDFRLGLAGMLAIPYLLLNLLEAPLNILYILDPIFILFLFLGIFTSLVNVNQLFRGSSSK